MLTLRRIFKAFQYRDFRLMWIGACTSSIGTWMQIVAQGWLIYRLSHSARLLALDQFLGRAPDFSFFALRRGDCRSGGAPQHPARLAVCADVQCQCAHSAGGHRARCMCGIFFACHSCRALRRRSASPAYSALIPTLVEKEDMPNAIALNSIQFNVAVMVGPALAGQPWRSSERSGASA